MDRLARITSTSAIAANAIIAKQYDRAPRLGSLCSRTDAEICRATLGDTAFLFTINTSSKPPNKAGIFVVRIAATSVSHTRLTSPADGVMADSRQWHRARDALFNIGIRTLVEHVRYKTGDKAGYFGEAGCRRLCPRAAWWCSARSASIAAARIPPIKCVARTSLNIPRNPSSPKRNRADMGVPFWKTAAESSHESFSRRH